MSDRVWSEDYEPSEYGFARARKFRLRTVEEVRRRDNLPGRSDRTEMEERQRSADVEDQARREVE